VDADALLARELQAEEYSSAYGVPGAYGAAGARVPTTRTESSGNGAAAAANFQWSGTVPNTRWRAIPMEHLREHPLFTALPPPYTVRATIISDCMVRVFSTEIYTRGCHWFPRLLASSEQACDQWYSSRLATPLTG
jgi:hypothetical protein